MGVIKRTIDFIKLHIVGEEQSDFIVNVLPNLKFGDVIYAERFNDDLEKSFFGEGHETGPYIVLGVDNDRVIGAYCTSSSKAKGTMHISKHHKIFHNRKNSYVTLKYGAKTIDEQAFLGTRYEHLTDSDIKRLKKKIFLNGDVTYDDFGIEKPVSIDEEFTYEPGDVVYYNRLLYTIYDVNDGCYTLFLTNLYSSSENQLNLDALRCNSHSTIKKGNTEDLYYINTLHDADFIMLKKRYEDYLTMINENIVKRGSLVKLDNKLYYTYDIKSYTANSFLVSEKPTVDDVRIKINGENYFTSFEDLCNIDLITDKYQLVDVASVLEMDQIKEVKKDLGKNINRPIRRNYDIAVGHWVNKDGFNEDFLVVKVNKKSVTIMSIPGILEGRKRQLEVNINQLVKRDNVSIAAVNNVKRKFEEIVNKDKNKDLNNSVNLYLYNDYAVGDIVNYHDHDYFVYRVKDYNCLAFRIKNYSPYIDVKLDPLNICPDYGCVINQPFENLSLVGSLDIEVKDWLIKEYIRCREINRDKAINPEKYQVMNTGWMICYNGCYYYVYRADALSAEVIPIYFNGVKHPKAIVINGLYYKPDYKQIKHFAYPNCKYHLIDIASEADIIDNANARVLRYNNNKKIVKTMEGFNMSDWIKAKNSPLTRYLIVGFEDNIIKAISIEMVLNGNELEYSNFDKNDCIKYDPTSIELLVLYKKLAVMKDFKEASLILK